MNPLKRFKKYIIGDALAATDDVFEKARIDLTYNTTLFFLALGLMFYANLIAHHYTWMVYITTIGVVSLPTILIILKKTGNVRYGAYLFVIEQMVISFLNQCLRNFVIDVQGAFWTMVSILFAFFVLGIRWGWIVTSYVLLMLAFGLINEHSGFTLIHFNVPPEQIPADQPYFVFLPFMINIYCLHRMMVTRRTAEGEIGRQKKRVEQSNKELESKNKDITDSINYARKIQYAVLPNEENIYRSIPLSFIVYKPRDIVSGDFFWFAELDEKSYILVTADCTGHGVPGAFMTVIGSSLLNQIIVEGGISEPSLILRELDKRINVTLKQEKERLLTVQDGMDLSLLKVDRSKKQFTFTSAKRPAIFIRDKQIREIKGSKFSLGGMRTGEKYFEELTMDYKEDDIIYFFTDGVTDQFGGEKGKKYSIKRLRELLLNIHMLPMHDQKKRLELTIEKWKGNLEQVDDICLVGIRF